MEQPTSKMSLNSVKILGVLINSSSTDLLLRKIEDFVAKTRLATPLLVFTPNPEFLVEAQKDKNFCELLNKADLNLPDGIGLVWAARILGTPVQERVSGADVVERLLEIGNKNKWAVGIAGARRGVQSEANDLLNRLQVKYPNLSFINLDDESIKQSLFLTKDQNKKQVLNIKVNILFAAHGMKKQEEWIWENKDKIKANVFMGAGGSLDFLTGFTRRAPLSIRQISLEWLWRGLQRPSHFKRIWRATVVFGWLVFKEKFL